MIWSVFSYSFYIKTTADCLSTVFQRTASNGVFQLQTSVSSQTLNPHGVITLFIAVKFRDIKHLTKKKLQSWYSSREALETMWCLEDKGLFVFFGKMRLYDSCWSVLSISNIHRFNHGCQAAGEHSGCEEVCSLRLFKDFKPAHLSPEDPLDREPDIVPPPSISLGHDRLISSWEQETQLLVAHSLGAHKEGNSCTISPPASSWIYIVTDCKEKLSLQTPCFWFTLTTVVLQFPYLCGFAFSVLWHLKPMADVKTELGFPELSTFDGRFVRPLKPQGHMGGEGVLWMARHRRERHWLFTSVTLSHHWTHHRDGKTQGLSRYHALNETEKSTLDCGY